MCWQTQYWNKDQLKSPKPKDNEVRWVRMQWFPEPIEEYGDVDLGFEGTHSSGFYIED